MAKAGGSVLGVGAIASGVFVGGPSDARNQAPKVQTPCGLIEIPLPGFEFQLPPFPPTINFPPKFSFPMPDCDIIKAAIGAATEPESDSLP